MRSRFLPLTVLLAALSFPATASADFAHTVTAGESLSSVAAADGLSVAQLAAANGVSTASALQAGTVLQIPAAGAPTTVAAGPATGGEAGEVVPDGDETPAATSVPTSAAAPSPAPGGYVVQPGDTLSAIAAANGVSVAELASENGLDPNAFLIAGSTLSLSGGSTTTPAAPIAAGSGAQPTAQMSSANDVGQIAAADGVSPSLAEAIGYQESGFNNGLVSSTGAAGVMQIEPATWSYIGRYLGPGLSPYSAQDNIRGGVLLLHSLLDQTGGDSALAAAGYYQGLQSVREHGVLPSTQQYVNNVLALQARFAGP